MDNIAGYTTIANFALSHRGVDVELVKAAVQKGMQTKHAEVVADCVDIIFQWRRLQGLHEMPEAQRERSFELLDRAMQTKHDVPPKVFARIIELAAKWADENRGPEPAIRSNRVSRY